jgi:hypothetical protein
MILIYPQISISKIRPEIHSIPTNMSSSTISIHLTENHPIIPTQYHQKIHPKELLPKQPNSVNPLSSHQRNALTNEVDISQEVY